MVQNEDYGIAQVKAMQLCKFSRQFLPLSSAILSSLAWAGRAGNADLLFGLSTARNSALQYLGSLSKKVRWELSLGGNVHVGLGVAEH